jgi:hypothetical protein
MTRNNKTFVVGIGYQSVRKQLKMIGESLRDIVSNFAKDEDEQRDFEKPPRYWQRGFKKKKNRLRNLSLMLKYISKKLKKPL